MDMPVHFSETLLDRSFGAGERVSARFNVVPESLGWLVSAVASTSGTVQIRQVDEDGVPGPVLASREFGPRAGTAFSDDALGPGTYELAFTLYQAGRLRCDVDHVYIQGSTA